MLHFNLQYILRTVIFRYLQGYAQDLIYFHCIEYLHNKISMLLLLMLSDDQFGKIIITLVLFLVQCV